MKLSRTTSESHKTEMTGLERGFLHSLAVHDYTNLFSGQSTTMGLIWSKEVFSTVEVRVQLTSWVKCNLTFSYSWELRHSANFKILGTVLYRL